MNPFQRWMVKSNLQTIKDGKMTADEVVNTLKANGYPSIAAEVSKALKLTP